MNASIVVYTTEGTKFEVSIDKETGSDCHSLFIHYPNGEPIRQFITLDQLKQLRDECNRALTDLDIDRITQEQGQEIERQVEANKERVE